MADSFQTALNQNCSYVQLSDKPVLFDPVSANVNVFFDDANQQVFVVRSNGTGGVLVFDIVGNSMTFRFEDRGEISAIRFSPDKKILALQRAPNAIDFINFIDGKDLTPYFQTCKGKTTSIADFFWCSNCEIIFVTDVGVEFYEVNVDRKAVKCSKTLSVGNINWSVWNSSCKMLLISTGVYGNIIHPFQYSNGVLTKFGKFEVELPVYPAEVKLALLGRDVILANIYHQLYVIILKQDAKLSSSAEITLYKLFKDQPTSKSNLVRLNMSGQFQLSIVDNLILVHHLQSKTTFVYDLKFATVNDQNLLIHQQPLVSPLPMRKASFPQPFVPNFSSQQTLTYELYSSTWILFQPDIIIDAKQGYMWKIEVNLPAFTAMISDRCLLIEFLLHRHGAKRLILEVLKEMVHPETSASLTKIGEIFNRLNQVYAYSEDSKLDVEQLSLINRSLVVDAVNIVQQDDIFTQVLNPLLTDDTQSCRADTSSFHVSVVIEYLASLQLFDLPIHYYWYDRLVKTLVSCGDFYRLHQFLQYHVLVDSNQLACLLLSIQSVYPPAFQIALDMFRRLASAHDQIVEVFLSRHQVLTAIKYMRAVGLAESIHPRKFLQVAKESGDADLFYTTYKYFEEKNVLARKLPHFLPSDHCEEYEQHFKTLFP